jgi:predicted nucleic acid-binding protein
MILVDSNVLLDLVTGDPVWAKWSQDQLDSGAGRDRLAINDVIYAELSIGYMRIEDADAFVAANRLQLAPMPRSALFLAGKAFRKYRAGGGVRIGVLPDFFIGAHAAVAGATLLTRDAARYRTYFPILDLIAPA